MYEWIVQLVSSTDHVVSVHAQKEVYFLTIEKTFKKKSFQQEFG